jgi:hypothetical protein
MINDILNGLGVTEVLKPEITAFSERSGSSTTSRSTTATADARYTVALPNGQIASNLTQAQYDTIKALLDIYNEAFALAKSNGLSVPLWSKYTTIENAQNALAKLKAQILRMEDFAEARDKANAAIAYQKKVINTPYISADERAKDIRKAVEDAKDAFGERAYKEVILEGNNEDVANREKLRAEEQYWRDNYEYVRQAEMDAVNGKIGSNSSSLPFPEWIIEMQKNESAQTTPTKVVMPTVQPPEEKQGSGILVPALIFAVGAIAAIVLVKSKPKRR